MIKLSNKSTNFIKIIFIIELSALFTKFYIATPTYSRYNKELNRTIIIESIDQSDILNDLKVEKLNPISMTFSTKDRIGENRYLDLLVEGNLKQFISLEKRVFIQPNNKYLVQMNINKNKARELLENNQPLVGKLTISFKNGYIKKEINLEYTWDFIFD